MLVQITNMDYTIMYFLKFIFRLDRPGRPPITFQLGTGQVIPGWERGLLDMCIGERRKLFIPSHLAYGKTGAGTSNNILFKNFIISHFF